MKELVPVLAAVALEGIKSIQTIGVEAELFISAMISSKDFDL